MTTNGITVQCVSCKAKKTLTFREAAAIDTTPFCETCFMPMVAVSGHVSSRRSGVELRKTIGKRHS